MTVEGHIENGQIVLDQDTPLPEGMKVRVHLLEIDNNGEHAVQETPDELPSLYERMESVIGSVEGLPSDMAINHDHYLHGQPKRQ